VDHVTNPAGRVLTLLERVQERPGISGPSLARDLGVTERTVRRYVATLQDLGIPVEPTRGRAGGYRLGPGYRMPPLMLGTDEAVAVTLALAVMRAPMEPAPDAVSGAPEGSPAATALAKLIRVLPRGVATRVDQVLAAVSAPADSSVTGSPPQPGLLATLAEGVVGRRQCRLRHRSQGGSVTVREVNPYGIAAVLNGWYLHAWCHLRQDRRTFRIDRIDRVDLLSTTFAAPEGLDIVAAVERSQLSLSVELSGGIRDDETLERALATGCARVNIGTAALARPEWAVTMLFDGPIEEVAQWIPRHLGVCEAVDAQTTRVRSSTSNPDYFVLRVSDHPFDMTVVEPDELRTAFGRQAERMRAAARGYAAQHEGRLR